MLCYTVYPKKYAHGFVVLCFVVVMPSSIMNSHEVFIHIHQGCFAGTGAIVRLPQCQWSKPDGYGKISQWIATTKHSKAKTCAYFLGYTVLTFSQQRFTRRQHLNHLMIIPLPVKHHSCIFKRYKCRQNKIISYGHFMENLVLPKSLKVNLIKQTWYISSLNLPDA